VVALVDVELDEETIVVSGVELEDVLETAVVDELVAVAIAPPGGSRWNIIPSEAGEIVLSSIGVPTAKPFVLDRRNMPFSLPVSVDGTGGLIAMVVHEVPS